MTANNAPPVFNQANYAFTLANTTQPGTVGTVVATDPTPGHTAMLNYSLVNNPYPAAFSIGAMSGQILYNGGLPPTAQSINLQVRATDPLNATGTANVVINVAGGPVNHPPTIPAGQPTAFTIAHDRTLTAPLPIGQDPDADPLTLQLVSNVTHGTLTLLAANFTYTPNAQYVGGDSFQIRYVDPAGAASPLVTITITVANAAPTINGIPPVVTVAEGTPVGTTVVQATATDSDDLTATFSIAAGNSLGYFSIDATGVIKVAANLDYEAMTQRQFALTVQATDPLGAVGTTTFTMQIGDVAPVAVNDNYSVIRNHALTLNVLANDTGDLNPASVVIETQPLHGTATVSQNQLVYTPTANYTGGDSFTYRVINAAPGAAAAGAATSNVATVYLNVTDPVQFENETIATVRPEDPPVGMTPLPGGDLLDLPTLQVRGIRVISQDLGPIDPALQAALSLAQQAIAGAEADWTTSEASDWASLDANLSGLATQVANAVQGHDDTLTNATAGTVIQLSDGTVSNMDALEAGVNGVTATLSSTLTSIAGNVPAAGTTGSPLSAATVNQNQLYSFISTAMQAEQAMKLAVNLADRQVAFTLDSAAGNYLTRLQDNGDQFSHSAQIVYADYALRAIAAGVDYQRSVHAEQVDYETQLKGLRTQWVADIKQAQTEFLNLLRPAKTLFENQADYYANLGAIQVRTAAAAARQAEVNAGANANNDPAVKQARHNLAIAEVQARIDLLTGLKPDFREFVRTATDALVAYAQDVAQANSDYVGNRADKFEDFADALVFHRRALMNELNDLATTRDQALNPLVTSTVERQITADDQLGQRIATAMKTRDDAVLLAAQQRDSLYMSGLGTLFNSASNMGTNGPSLVQSALNGVQQLLTAAQTAVANVNGHFKTSISSFITEGTAFQSALNAAASSFNSSMLGTLQQAVSDALTARSDYDYLVNTADKDYADAASSADAGVTLARAQSVKQQELDQIDAWFNGTNGGGQGWGYQLLAAQQRLSLLTAQTNVNDPAYEMKTAADPLKVARLRVGLEFLENQLASWNPAVEDDIPAPLTSFEGLTNEAPAWLADLQATVNGWTGNLSNPPGGSSVLAQFGFTGNTAGLPAWLTTAATAVLTGQAQQSQGWPVNPNLNNFSTTMPPVALTNASWASQPIFGNDAEVIVGGKDTISGQVVRPLAPGVLLGAAAADVNQAKTATAHMTSADWDVWFAGHGSYVVLDSNSSSSLGSLLAGFAQPAGTSLSAVYRAQSATLLLDRLNNNPSPPPTSQTFTYAQLEATLASFATPGVAGEFTANYGLGGLARVAVLLHAGWQIELQPLGMFIQPNGVWDPGADHDFDFNACKITVNVSSLSPSSVAPVGIITNRLWIAITSSQVTTSATGFTGYDSPLLAALTTPRMQALARAGFASLQILGGMGMIAGTGGIGSVPGAYTILRGVDELFAAVSTSYNNNQIPERSFGAWAIDKGTGNQTTTDRILFVTDIGTGIWGARAALRNAANQARLEAQAAQAATGGASSNEPRSKPLQNSE